MPNNTPHTDSRTLVRFDLPDELTPEEIAKFEASAAEAGESLTEHFLNLTLRLTAPNPKAA